MVWIKRFFCIFFVIALLFNFSSCGLKESNDFQEVNFQNEQPIRIVYRQKEYSAALSFNGKLLVMKIFFDNDEFKFSVDNMTCTTEFMDLTKTYQTEEISASFLPVTVFGFFNQIGYSFKTEVYDESTGAHCVSRSVDTASVCLDVYAEEGEQSYILRIN